MDSHLVAGHRPPAASPWRNPNARQKSSTWQTLSLVQAPTLCTRQEHLPRVQLLDLAQKEEVAATEHYREFRG